MKRESGQGGGRKKKNSPKGESIRGKGDAKKNAHGGNTPITLGGQAQNDLRSGIQRGSSIKEKKAKKKA